MTWFINQSLLVILATFLLGMLVGWLVWGRKKSSPPRPDETSVARPGGTGGPDIAVTPTAHAEPRHANLPTRARGGRVVAGQDVRAAGQHDGSRATENPSTAEPATRAVAPAAAAVEPATTAVGLAAAAVEPVDTRGDELERIEGVGPKMAAALRAAGIHTFRQLAEADDDTRRAAIEAAGLTFAPSLVTWGRQARLLADGDEAGFAELTELLVAGRDTGRA